MRICRPLAAFFTLLIVTVGRGQPPAFDSARLPDLGGGRVEMQNALWIENPLTAQFQTTNRVVVADIKGPATITMIHFAMPQTLKLNRDLLLKMYWDGEETPSVDCPLVDFFCDPAGLRQEVNTALVNKRRGFNAYFPMPFRKSARTELVYDGPLRPSQKLWEAMPCYSYVMYRREEVGASSGYFHACWRQEGLLLGARDYFVAEMKGRGKFVGWNVTVRRPGRSDYPVDENEKFFIDGEQTASIEFQGIEDSFGFSWGYPESQSFFPLTGYFPFFQGGAAYRFFINDAITFEQSLRVDDRLRRERRQIHCRASETEVQIELALPKQARGTARVFVLDPDNFQGGRRQTLLIAGKSLGEIKNFENGRWFEQRLEANDTASGKVLIAAKNAREGANAVISIVEWVESDAAAERNTAR